MKPQLNFWRFLFIACLFLLLTGCVVPFPLGSEITAKNVQGIKAGITTRAEINTLLGKPNVLDEPLFSVYRLSEGMWARPYLKDYATEAGETYDLTFSFDSSGIVKEFNYETRVTRDSHGLKSLDEEFPDQSTEILGDSYALHVNISRDGRWVSAISKDDKLVLHEIDDKSNTIDIKGLPRQYTSVLSRDACKLEFQAVQDRGSSESIEWLFANADLTPFYKLCRRTQSDSLMRLQLQLSEDGSILAVGDKNNLALWSGDQGALRSVTTTEMSVTNISFSPDNSFLASIGTSGPNHLTPFISARYRHTYISEINLWSVPSLVNIAKIERKVPPYATAFSEDGRFFSLASATHIEIWERSGSEGWPYKLEKIIPQPVIGSYESLKWEGLNPYRKSLSFSSDGKLLMSVNGLLHIWDTRSGKLLAQLGAKFGLLKAAFNRDNDIVIAGGAYKGWSGSSGVRVWKIPLSAVVTQSEDLPDPGTELTSKSGLLIPSGSSPEVANRTDQLKPTKTLKIEDDSRSYAAKMRSLISGNTESGIFKKGSKYLIYYNPNGTMLGRSTNKYNTESKDSGVWEVLDSGQICLTWKKWQDQKQHCYSYGTNTVFREGDPEGLLGDSAVRFNETTAISNITGTYISSITGNWHFAFTLDGPTPEVNLEQNGSEIKGSFGSHGGKIWGVIEGDAVSFNWLGLGTRGGTGKWIFKRGSDDIEGNWSTSYGIDATGTWNLKKIE